MLKKAAVGIGALILLSIVAIGVALAPSTKAQEGAGLTPFQFLIATLSDVRAKELIPDYINDQLSQNVIEYLIAPDTGEGTEEVRERLSSPRQSGFQFLMATLLEANDRGVLSDYLCGVLSDWFIETLIAPHTGETSDQVRERLSSQPAVTPVLPTIRGELPGDDPPLNFRVTGYTDTWAWVQWEVPRNRGIASFVLQKYDHDDNGFVADPYRRWEGEASGGYGFGKSYGDLTPDTRYKFTLTLKNAQGATVIQQSVELHTPPQDDAPILSSDAKLSDLTLSGVDLGGFAPYKTLYRANVPSDIAQVTVTPTLNHSGASYVIKLNGVVDADGVIPLTQVNNVIAIEVTAEDGIVSETYTVYITSVARSTPTSTTTNPTATPITIATSTPTHTPTPVATSTPTLIDTPTPTPTPTTGELPNDNPPVNFRVSSYTDTLVWVQWEVPRNRGIASYVLQKYDHDGNGFVTDPYGRFEDEASGGYAFGQSYGNLTPDTRYKFTLTLKNGQGATVIQKSVEVRTLGSNNTPTPTPVAIDTPIPTKTSVAPPTPVKDTPTPTPVSTDTPTPTPTPVATYTPTPTPVATHTPTPTPISGDNPPVNFRVSSYTDTLVWVRWEVPHNRGIASYVLQKYDHDGNGFVEDPHGRLEGEASGGYAFGQSYGLTPDTRYKFTLTLKNAQGATVIQKSVEVRTLQSGSTGS